MIDKILEFSVRQRVLVLMGALALLLGGLWSATKLPMDAIPDITGVQVQVNTTVPALAPDEVEKLVTVPLEMALGGVAGVTEMRSLSRFGLSQITLQFTDKSDIYRARQLVTERLQSAADSLPPGLTPKLIPITTGLGEVFYYTIDYAPNAPNAPPTREAQLMALWEMQEYIPSRNCVPFPVSLRSTLMAATLSRSSCSRTSRSFVMRASQLTTSQKSLAKTLRTRAAA